jgi:hypothetical protein
MKPDFKENLAEDNLTINEKAELDTLEGIIKREMGSFVLSAGLCKRSGTGDSTGKISKPSKNIARRSGGLAKLK